MALNHQRVTNPRFIREHIELVRHAAPGWGGIRCDTCHGPALTKAELAGVIGVSTSTLTNFLNKRSLTRADIADKIRNAVKAVHE